MSQTAVPLKTKTSEPMTERVCRVCKEPFYSRSQADLLCDDCAEDHELFLQPAEWVPFNTHEETQEK